MRESAVNEGLLQVLAEKMIQQSKSQAHDRIFSASGYANENISILHQQLRCTNLAWALDYTGQLHKGDVVAIVGGSISGIMLATTLAMTSDVIVYLFEKEKALLSKFRTLSSRFISPNLNFRYLGKNFHPTHSAPQYTPAIFDWNADRACEVAHRWIREFQLYEKRLPIFCFFDQEVRDEHLCLDSKKLEIRLDSDAVDNSARVKVDLIIDATGFGPEGNPHNLEDSSYWESGHKLIYDHVSEGSKVLISGCGDSGVIELLHYAFKNFDHTDISNYWFPKAGIEAHIDENIERSNFQTILGWKPPERMQDPPLPEIFWYCEQKENIAGGYENPLKGEPYEVKAVFRKMDQWMETFINNRHPKLVDGEWSAVEDAVFSMSKADQHIFRQEIRPEIKELASVEIGHFMRAENLNIYLPSERIKSEGRENIDIVLNGLTPTAYSMDISSGMVWYLCLALQLPNVGYRYGQISEIKPTEHGKYKVIFREGESEDFDRVVTRYGITRENWKSLSVATPKAKYSDDPLLTVPEIHRRTKDRHIMRRIDVAKDRILRAKQRVLLRRQFKGASQLVDKCFYRLNLFQPANELKLANSSCERSYIEHDQEWLSNRLRKSQRVTYQPGHFHQPGDEQ